MKLYKLYLPLLVVCLAFFSCQKDSNSQTVIVGVKINGKYTTNPTVYMKSGTLTKPTGSYTWTKTQAGGEDGKATFENLSSGNYYFYAKEYGSSSYVTGEIGVSVAGGGRTNWKEVTIDLK